MNKDNSNLIIVIVVIAGIILLFGGFGMMGFGGMMGGFGMGFGWIFMLLLIGAVIWLIVTLTNQARSDGKIGDDASEILKRRYAKGEISKKEYEEMKKELDK